MLSKMLFKIKDHMSTRIKFNLTMAYKMLFQIRSHMSTKIRFNLD